MKMLLVNNDNTMLELLVHAQATTGSLYSSSASACHSPDIPSSALRLRKLIRSLFDTLVSINPLVSKLSRNNQPLVSGDEPSFTNSHRFFFFCPSPPLLFWTTTIASSSSSSSAAVTLLDCRVPVGRAACWRVFSPARLSPPRS